MVTTKEQKKWIPPIPELWSPDLWTKNTNYMAKSIMVHQPSQSHLNLLEILPSLAPYLYDVDLLGFRPTLPRPRGRTQVRRIIIAIDRLQVKHLPYLGPAYDGERAICWMPWVLSYIKECLLGGEV